MSSFLSVFEGRNKSSSTATAVSPLLFMLFKMVTLCVTWCYLCVFSCNVHLNNRTNKYSIILGTVSVLSVCQLLIVAIKTV